MGKVYINQSKLVINFNLGSDITGAIVVIEGFNPLGVAITNLTALVINASQGTVQYTSGVVSDFTIIGTYKLWAYVEFPDGRKIWGEPSYLEIHKTGS